MKTQNEAQHTPTPWKMRAKSDFPMCNTEHDFCDPAIGFSLSCDGVVAGYTNQESNAKFIVHAVNSHEALLEAVKTAEKWLVLEFPHFEEEKSLFNLIGSLREAIAQAEGK